MAFTARINSEQPLRFRRVPDATIVNLVSAYNYATFDDPLAAQGFDGTIAYGINGSGQIVGWYQDGQRLEEGLDKKRALSLLRSERSMTNCSSGFLILYPDRPPGGSISISAASGRMFFLDHASTVEDAETA